MPQASSAARRPFPRAGVYLVADAGTRSGPALAEAVAAALAAGVRLVQYRNKGPLTRGMVAEARALRALTRRHGAGLIVNDRLDLALMVEADGVHVGQDDLAPADVRRLMPAAAWVGVSVHDPDEARAAEREGADYLGFGNLFGTRTKPDAVAPRGVDALAVVCRAAAVPVYGIGGVTEANLGLLKTAGATGGAVVSAVLAAKDPGAASARLLAAWEGAAPPAAQPGSASRP